MCRHDGPFTSPLAEALAPELLERFLRYVRVDTQSARNRTETPSTPRQLDLARMLAGSSGRSAWAPWTWTGTDT